MLTEALPFFQEVFDNDHRVISQRGGSSGRFTFTAAEAGEHRMCFTPSSNSGRQGWLSTAHPNGGIRLTLDLAIGESSEIESTDKDKLQDIQARIRDLNARLQDIRREQVFQRVGFFCFGVFQGRSLSTKNERKKKKRRRGGGEEEEKKKTRKENPVVTSLVSGWGGMREISVFVMQMLTCRFNIGTRG